MIYYTNKNSYLMHHGILGQRWGVRRYQNEDGSLTAAGKTRYRSSSDHARELNDLDKEKVDVKYNLDKYGSKMNKYNRRAEKAEAKGNLEKSSIYKNKANQAESKYSEYAKKAEDVDKRTSDAIKRAIDAGYDVSMTSCKRSPATDRGKRIVANAAGLMLSTMSYVSGVVPVTPFVIATTKYGGYKYKVNPGANSETGHVTTTVKSGIHRSSFTEERKRNR